MIAITGTLTSDFNNPTMGTTDTCSHVGYNRMIIHQTMVTARHAYIRDAVDVKMDYWEWLFDWSAMVELARFAVEPIRTTIRNLKFYDIRQPKPKSRLRARLYK